MRFVAAFCALILGAPMAMAGAVEDCNQLIDLDRQFRGCSAYINDVSAPPESRAIAHLNRANILARRGKFANAFSDFASAIALDPRNPLPLYNRGNAYFDTGVYRRAIADYTAAIRLDATFALAYLNRGLAHEKMGAMQPAASDYSRAIEFDPTFEKARTRLQGMRANR